MKSKSGCHISHEFAVSMLMLILSFVQTSIRLSFVAMICQASKMETKQHGDVQLHHLIVTALTIVHGGLDAAFGMVKCASQNIKVTL